LLDGFLYSLQAMLLRRVANSKYIHNLFPREYFRPPIIPQVSRCNRKWSFFYIVKQSGRQGVEKKERLCPIVRLKSNRRNCHQILRSSLSQRAALERHELASSWKIGQHGRMLNGCGQEIIKNTQANQIQGYTKMTSTNFEREPSLFLRRRNRTYSAADTQAVACGERWVHTVRKECLDQLFILDQCHLQLVLAEYIAFYIFWM
jgi:hypothetical protein